MCKDLILESGEEESWPKEVCKTILLKVDRKIETQKECEIKLKCQNERVIVTQFFEINKPQSTLESKQIVGVLVFCREGERWGEPTMIV